RANSPGLLSPPPAAACLGARRGAQGHRHGDSSPGDDNCHELVPPARSVYCRVVSTRAIVAHTSSDGAWKGVWNDSNSEPQQLGRVLLRRVTSAKGDLDKFVAQFIEGCPE